MRTALGTIVMLIATSAIAQDHLRPEAGDLWNRDEYYAKIRKVFADTLRHDIVVELVFVPSFQPDSDSLAEYGAARKNRETAS